jgi:hypothetical protein
MLAIATPLLCRREVNIPRSTFKTWLPVFRPVYLVTG